MNKAKRRLQLSASIISVLALIAIIVIFILQNKLVDNMYGDPTISLLPTLAIIMSLLLLPGIIINLIMLKKPRNTKTHKGLRITSCILVPFYAFYFCTGTISVIPPMVTDDFMIYVYLSIVFAVILVIAFLLLIISFCVGNPKKKKLFVEDADLKIQTICRLQQMNLITKEEAKHFIFIQATK